MYMNNVIVTHIIFKMQIHTHCVPLLTVVFKKCSTQLRGSQCKVGHDQYGIEVP